MSPAATSLSPTTIFYCNPTQRPTKRLLLCTTTPLVPLTNGGLSFPLTFKYPTRARTRTRTRSRTFLSPVMKWQDFSVKKEIDVPVGVAYKAYMDRESVPRWMPSISSVKILEEKPDQSRWSFKHRAFGHDVEFSWLATIMKPIPNRRIQWRSLEGLPNRGTVRFFPKSPTSCLLELTVSYEVPPIMVPVAAAMKPLIENLLTRGLERFAIFAKSYQ